MRFLASLVTLTFTASLAAAQNCGPQYGGQICAPGNCCSQYGWCDTSAAHCDPPTCLRAYSGAGSSCAGTTPPPPPPPPPSSFSTSTTTAPPTTWPSTIPSIDICGAGSGGITCPGVGSGGFFYRCCSQRGHCGPKNSEQAQGDYCGSGCQAGYGACDTRPFPAQPPAPHPVSTDGTCGPIVNRRCPAGQCCSGSNFCGTGVDFCGAANWCQIGWGDCHR